MASEPERTYPSELPVVALARNGRLPADAAAARDQPADVDRVGQPRAERRPPDVPRRCRTPTRTSPTRTTSARSAPSPPSGRWRRCPTGGIHVIVEGLTRAKASWSPGPASRARDGGAGARRRRALARSRRARAAAAGADRPRAVAGERAVAGAARPGVGHRRSAAARLSALEPARHEGGREAAHPRGGRPHQKARDRRRRP